MAVSYPQVLGAANSWRIQPTDSMIHTLTRNVRHLKRQSNPLSRLALPLPARRYVLERNPCADTQEESARVEGLRSTVWFDAEDVVPNVRRQEGLP
jgi:hypothetical protein